MAISLNNVVINKKEFELNGDTLEAEYTPEVDEKYANIELEIHALFDELDNADEDLDLDEQKAELKRVTDKLRNLSISYIKAIFSKEDAQKIIDASGNRVVNIATLAGMFADAGNSDDIEKAQQEQLKEQALNRKGRRNKGKNKKG